MKLTRQWLIENNACIEGQEFFSANGSEGVEAAVVIPDFVAKGKHEWANWLLVRVLSVDGLKAYLKAVLQDRQGIQKPMGTVRENLLALRKAVEEGRLDTVIDGMSVRDLPRFVADEVAILTSADVEPRALRAARDRVAERYIEVGMSLLRGQ
jgi:hypothetical protein